MAYPASYRNKPRPSRQRLPAFKGSAAGRGLSNFARSAARLGPLGPLTTPVWPRGFVPMQVPAAARGAMGRAAMMGGLRMGARFIPYVGAALLLLDLLLLLRRYLPGTLPGWTLFDCTTLGVPNCPPTTAQFYRQSSCDPGCIGSQSVSFIALGPHGPAVTQLQAHKYLGESPVPGSAFFQVGRVWTRNGGNTATLPQRPQWSSPEPISEQDPDWLPGVSLPRPGITPPLPGAPQWLDPEATPPLSPGQAPENVPFRFRHRRRYNEWRSPSEQTQTGPYSIPRPRPRPVPVTPDPPVRPEPEPEPKPRPRPRPRPSPRPEVDPRTDPRTEPRNPLQPVSPGQWPRGEDYPHHEWQVGQRVKPRLDRPSTRPPRRTKETKLSAGRWYHSIMAVLNFVTEANDAVGALWEALPKKRRKGRLPQERAEAVYRYWHEIDLELAIKFLIYNQLEDMAYGMFSQLTGKAARQRGLGVQQVDAMGRAIRELGLDPIGELLQAFQPHNPN